METTEGNRTQALEKSLRRVTPPFLPEFRNLFVTRVGHVLHAA